MEHQKCRICGERHPLRGGCPKFKAEKIVKAIESLPKIETTRHIKPEAEIVAAFVNSAFDRKAYQRDYMREYMRKRRAAEKAKAKPS